MIRFIKLAIAISNFEGLSLKQDRNVVLFVCKKEHSQPCSRCEGLCEVTSEVISSGFRKLKSALKYLVQMFCDTRRQKQENFYECH